MEPVPDQSTFNYKDMALKLFWTMLNAAVAFAIVYVTDLDAAWGAVALAALQVASTFVRQKLGATPPEAPEVGPLPKVV